MVDSLALWIMQALPCPPITPVGCFLSPFFLLLSDEEGGERNSISVPISTPKEGLVKSEVEAIGRS